jgi:hypothetical protein
MRSFSEIWILEFLDSRDHSGLQRLKRQEAIRDSLRAVIIYSPFSQQQNVSEDYLSMSRMYRKCVLIF